MWNSQDLPGSKTNGLEHNFYALKRRGQTSDVDVLNSYCNQVIKASLGSLCVVFLLYLSLGKDFRAKDYEMVKQRPANQPARHGAVCLGVSACSSRGDTCPSWGAAVYPDRLC